MTTNNPSKAQILKNTVVYVTYLLLVWGLYRHLFKLPDEFEEYIVKPIIWLLPIAYFLYKEKASASSIGLTTKNIFPAIYLSFGFGILFAGEAILVNYVKYSGFHFTNDIGNLPITAAFLMSLATAVSEEVSFRGFVFGRLSKVFGNSYFANIITSLIWTLIHIPAVIFVMKLNLGVSIGYLVLIFIFGIGSSFVYSKTQNILSSVLLHFLWQWPIVLFR